MQREGPIGRVRWARMCTHGTSCRSKRCLSVAVLECPWLSVASILPRACSFYMHLATFVSAGALSRFAALYNRFMNRWAFLISPGKLALGYVQHDLFCFRDVAMQVSHGRAN